MKKAFFNQAAWLFRKAVWFFLFVSLLSLNFFSTTGFFAGLCEVLSITSANSQREMSKQTDPNKTFPFSNPNEEKSDSNTRDKDLDEIIYSKNRRVIFKKTTLALDSLSYAVLNKIPENELFPGNFPNPSNTCFAPLYRFTIF